MNKTFEVIDQDNYIELRDKNDDVAIKLNSEEEVMAVIRLLVKTVRDKSMKHQLAHLLTVENG